MRTTILYSALAATAASIVLAYPGHLAQPDLGRVRALPARFIADRMYAAPVTARGDTLLLYLDTGSGVNMLYPRTLVRLGLRADWVRQGNDSIQVVALPPLGAGTSIPLPGPASPIGAKFLVLAPEYALGGDGFLGRTWFADRVWRLDYLGHTLALVGDGMAAASATGARTRDPHGVRLGFQVDSACQRTTQFPRIRVEIDGDSLDLLFDTGATVTLTDAAWAALRGDGEPQERGTSFIAQNVFERWRQRHPDWRVVEHADRVLDMPMILVPEIHVGGYAVGPAWFTMRPDKNFHQFMSQWMDRRVEGALGGSVLRSFRVTLDYPGATATFER